MNCKYVIYNLLSMWVYLKISEKIEFWLKFNYALNKLKNSVKIYQYLKKSNCIYFFDKAKVKKTKKFLGDLMQNKVFIGFDNIKPNLLGITR